MKNKPNILLILSDQHRYDCTGYSKDYPVSTPNIDRLASEGMWFENAFTPVPLCCPARQALINGRRPEVFGALWNYDNALKIPALEPSEYSWARDLKNIGYRTGYVGKWHVNPVHNPTEYGFDDYIENEYNAYRDEKYPEVKLSRNWFGEKDPAALEDTHTHWFARQTTQLVEKYTDEGGPWMIRLNFFEPHLPCRPAEPFSEMYRPDEIPEWRSFQDKFENKPYIQRQQLYNWGIENMTWDDWAPVVARYYGIISQMDDAIGMVLKKLEHLGLTENTIVIYSTDHGDMCGGHKMMDKHYVLYDDIVKVPLVVRWPGVIKQGAVCNEFISNCLDIPPTILDMLGLPQKEFFHGRSMLPLLEGNKVNNWRKEIVSTYNGQQFGLYTQRMIRNNRWKYIWNTTDVDELYDMENDPDELSNVIYEKTNAPVIAELREKLYRELLRDGDGLVRSPWMKEQLLRNRKI